MFCVTEQEAEDAAAADPATYAVVRRRDSRKRFLGLQVQLRDVPVERISALAEEAWRQQAPKRLAAEHEPGK